MLKNSAIYYPVQIPYILDRKFSENMKYMESVIEECSGFVICFWEMLPLSEKDLSITNVIVTDACIDIVVSFDEKQIGVTGMSKTEFDFTLESSKRSFGMRMKPGAFHQFTGIAATVAMDNFLHIESVFEDFDRTYFFTLSYEEAKEYLKRFLINKTKEEMPNQFTTLFDTLSKKIPSTVTELCTLLHFSQRQCQRLFRRHYGITPKMALSIMRFHKCMERLTSPNVSPSDIINITEYYDQSHFIKDFKRNIGITPLELVRAYQT